MQNHAHLTLGQLLSHTNSTIQRNAVSILKTLQRIETPACQLCNSPLPNHSKYCPQLDNKLSSFDRNQYEL